MNERSVFLAALDIPDPVARIEYLARIYSGNPTSRQKVEALLEAHGKTGEFLDSPVLQQLADDVARTSSGEETIDGPSNHRAISDLGFLVPSTKPGSLGRIGHYEITSELGRGGFGIVFKGFDEKLHRVVAIKVLNPNLATTSPPRKRFIREARSAAGIRHENVVTVFSVEEHPVPYLVMEYVSGESLQSHIDRTGPLDISEIIRFARQIAGGLAAAHESRVIHRDIKPANILIEAGPETRVKLTDFGLARAADDASLTQSGTVAGTPMYMSPEQARGEQLDARSDLFSLGSVMYVMATGRPPFRAESTLGVLMRVAQDSPRSIREVVPEVPEWLCDIIKKLHQKNPENRYQSASDLIDALNEPKFRKTKSHRKIWRRSFVGAGVMMIVAATIFAAITSGFGRNNAVNETPAYVSVANQIIEPTPKTSLNPSDNAEPKKEVNVNSETDYAHVNKREWIPLLKTSGEYRRAIADNPRPADPQKVMYSSPDRFSFENESFETRGGSLYFPAIVSKNAVIRAKVEKFRGQNIYLGLRSGGDGSRFVAFCYNGNGYFCIGQGNNGWRDFTNITISDDPNTEFEMAFSAVGRTLTGYRNGKRILQAEYDIPEGEAANDGQLGFGATSDAIGRFANVEVQLLDPKYTADRIAAIRVLQLGGSVVILAGGEKFVNKVIDLPESDFTLLIVNMDGVKTVVGRHELSILVGLKHLRDLNLSLTSVTGADLAALESLTTLKYLNLFVTRVGFDGIAHIAKLHHLEHLNLRGTRVTDAGLQSIGKLKNLKDLDLWDTKITDAGLEHLAGCKNIYRLTLGGNNIGNETASRLARFPKLFSVDLWGTKIDQHGLKQLAKCPNLRELGLGATNVTDEGLEYLADFPMLERVAFNQSHAKITNAALLKLAKIKTLKSLDVSNTNVNDLAGLAGSKIEYLNLFQTTMNDDGIKALAKCQTLKNINLQRTQVTEAGVKQLSKALPECTIDWNGGTVRPSQSGKTP